LRLDYNNSNYDWWDVDPFSGGFFTNSYNPTADYPKIKPKADWQLSPRLGIAHPITENSKLFFNYGHFKQVPQYETLFRNERERLGQMVSFGNPNLVMAKTISYELGYDHILFEDYMFQLAAFYNDITNQQDVTSYDLSNLGITYTQTTANNYSDVRGFEVTLRKTRGRWWSGFANYTYQVTSSGHFGRANRYSDPGLQKNYDDATNNMYQDRPIPQPYARANLNFYSPDDFGPVIWGHHVLGGFLATAVLDWQAGYWDTWNPGQSPSIAYNVKAVDFFNTTLRLEKSISFKMFRVHLFMDINNVFNTLRLWGYTGDKAYMASLHLPKSEDYGNIPGDDKVGDYRRPGVEFQPIENQAVIDRSKPGFERPIYYESKTGSYWQYVDNQNLPVYQRWSKVDAYKLKGILRDKAYIDMPNASTFWFLNPRDIFLGIRISFNFGQ
jgi:outer membrane receptor protein involved in Fe transport